ncbi:MAG: hypothetical protein GXP29_03075, partial [Planctomycetes bacterium]|nr:hypothetical protein [Planctomycetota bacterium]
FNEAIPTIWLRTAVDIGFGHDQAGCAGSIVRGITPNRQGLSDLTTTSLSVTRAMWMLVRGGDMTPKSFICPSSGDQIENNQNVDCYYDFRGSKNISYGYQVPYGPFSTRGSEDIDPRMAVMSDSSPYGTLPAATALPLSSSEWGNPTDTTGNNPGGLMSPQAWKPFNSPNHGGKGTGEGQNVLFGDGHALFHKNPLQGIDNDNMFTKMDVNATGVARQSGLLPSGLYPGQNTFSATIGDSTTDTLIYP